MSTTALPGRFGTSRKPARASAEPGANDLAAAQSSARQPASGGRFVRRRASLHQGMALETLGHAVEYLVDSRMFAEDPDTRADQEAIQILMRLSRQVFAECPEVIPLHRRLGAWLIGRAGLASKAGRAAR